MSAFRSEQDLGVVLVRGDRWLSQGGACCAFNSLMPFAVLGPTKARTGSRTGTWVASANYEVFLREDDDVYYVFIPISGGGPRRCASPARFRRVCDGAGLTAASPRRGAKGGGGWGLGGPA